MKLGKLLILVLAIILAGSVCALAQMPPNLENGFKHWGSYDGGSLDTVNNLNGNQMLHAPLLPNYPQRGGGLTLQTSLYQTSKVWQETCKYDIHNTLICQWSLQRAGVNLRQSEGLTILRTLHQWSSGTGTSTYSAYGYSIHDSSGAAHQMVGTGPLDSTGESTKFDSIDTSGYHIEMSNPDGYGVMNAATVTDRHGNQYVASSWFGGTDTGPTLCPQLPGNRLPPVQDGGPGNLIAPIIDDAPFGQQDCPQAGFATQVTDSNGNRMALDTVTDTLGRNVAFFNNGVQTSDYSGCVSSHTISAAGIQNYTAPDGTTRQMKLCSANIPISTAFNASGISDTGSIASPQLVTVALADGSKWTFDYDNYGEVTFVGLPAGGSISYTWTTVAFPSCAVPDGGVSRAVASRTVNDNNGHSSTWNYSWGTVVNGVISNIVTDPLSNDTVHVFTALDGTSAGDCGFYETRTQSYQGTGGSRQLLKQVDTTYSTAFYGIEVSVGSGMGSVVPTSIQTTIYPSGKVSLVQKTYAPPPATGQPISGAVATEKVFDWGQGAPGALLRETDTTYQWQVNNAYLTAHLIDLPASVITKDGSGNRVAETDYTYDEPAYLTAANISTQHFAPPGPVRGNLTTVSHWLNTSNSWITSHTNWYDTGEAYQSIDPLGHITTHSYDPAYVGAYSTQTCNTLNHCVSGTYDFTTGVLTSLTNENATSQASGNTPGDSAHTSTYVYDFLWRITSAQAPPDPANNNARATTTLNYSAPNVFPLSVQHSKSITPTMNDSATSLFDGLGRPYQSQHVTPGGTAKVDTTYDGLGQVSDVTNPYFTTSDATYGTTHSDYDALGRAIKITKQDGSVATMAYTDNCTTSTDEAGKQRRACSDGLGRLIEVDEPNPNAAATNATGSITVSGSEQTANSQPAAAGHGSVTISGQETSATVNICLDPDYCPHTFWDTGSVSISINGHTDSVSYGQHDTPLTIASGLVSAINGDSAAPVTASASGATVNLTAKTTGVATNYSLSATATTSDPSDFGGSSFAATVSAANLTGGQNTSSTPDTGTVSATISGTAYTVSYGAGDTAATVATRLAAAISGGNLANASASGGAISLTSKVTGPSGDYSLAASFTWNSGQFTNPSFTTSTSGGSLTGGYNASDFSNNPYVTLYTYNALGNLLRVDQKGSASSDSSQWRTRLFTYNSLGQLLTAYNPESGTVTYQYDNDGNMISKTSPAANQPPGSTLTQTISYCYDALHRVTGKAYSAQVCPLSTPVVSYTYDAGPNAIGRLTSLMDQAGTASYGYDVLGRMTTEQRTIAGVSKTVSYDYNLDGSLKVLHYPSSAAVTYAPDSAGRILSAIDSGSGINYVTGATYGPDSALTGFLSGNTITNSFSYNKRLQPVFMSASSPTQTVFSIGYDFHVGNGTTGGDNGNVFAITNNKDATRNQSFTYDLLNRLASAQNAGTDCSATPKPLNPNQTKFWGNGYTYDAWGNLTSKGNLPGATSPKCNPESLDRSADAQNRLHVKAGADYQYDAAGNMTYNASGMYYSYDQENRITGAGGYTYVYDGDGNRVEKTTGGSSPTGTLYWYMSAGIVAESDLVGNLQSEYVFFDGERVARRDGPTGAGGMFYYFSDHLKTASVVTDASGTILNESDFYPWGGELQFVNNVSNHYKYGGHERDSETNLDYYGARYYGNALGRFLTPDWAAKATAVPYANFGNPQSLNLYAYTNNNPTTFGDPDGHQCPGCLGETGWVCQICGRAVEEMLTNPKQAGKDAVQALASVAQSFFNLLPYGDNKPSPNYVPPSGATVPNSAVGHMTATVAGLATIALPGPKGGAVVDMTAAARGPGVIRAAEEGETVFRTWSSDGAAMPNGRYWTRTDPDSLTNFRDLAGLPNVNKADWTSVGTLKDATGVEVSPATPLDGNIGGLIQLKIPNPVNQVELRYILRNDPPK